MLLRKCLSRSRLVFTSIKKAIKRIQVHESQVISMRQIFLPEFTDFENRSSDVTSFMWRRFERVQSTAVAWPVFFRFSPPATQWSHLRSAPHWQTMAWREKICLERCAFSQNSAVYSPRILLCVTRKIICCLLEKTCLVITRISRNGLKFGSESSCSHRWRSNMVICNCCSRHVQQQSFHCTTATFLKYSV